MTTARIDPKEIEEKATQIYRRAINSLVSFYYIFLADTSIWKPPADFHYQISDILLKEKGHFAIEAFRESGKSSYVLKAFPLYSLLFPAKSRKYIVIIQRNQRQASKTLKEIISLHRSNPLLSYHIKRTYVKNGEAYEVTIRNFGIVRIEAYGKGASIRGLMWRGRRPSIIILDDPQDLEDMYSPTVLEKDWDWFLSEVMFLGKSSRIFVIGNNLGEKCIIERIFANSESLGFKTLKIPALTSDGKATWKEQFSEEFLEAERERFRKEGKLDIWYRERLCEAIVSEQQTFRREYFSYYSPNLKSKLLQECNIYMTVDLAISEKETADYTAIVVVGVNADNHWFVLDVVYGRFNPTETIDHIFELVKRYRPLKVGIEKVQYQAALQHFLEKEMRARNLFFNIVELKANKQKEIRIKTLQPRFAQRLIHFPDIADWLPEMETELLTFPRGLHDDLCVVEGTCIITNEGVKKIEEVEVGDLVLTHKGRFKPVLKTFKREIDKEVVKIGRNTLALRVTKNHPIYVSTAKYSYKHKNGKQKYLGVKVSNKYQFVDAYKLLNKPAYHTRWLVHSPKISKIRDYVIDITKYVDEFIEENGYIYGVCKPRNAKKVVKNIKSNPIKRFIKVDEKFAFIIGYYLAEGSINNSHAISFAAHKDEVICHDFIEKVFAGYGINNRHTNFKQGNGVQTSFYSKPLMNFFKTFGSHINKKILEWVYYLPVEQIKTLLAGYFFGDGNFTEGKARVSSISEHLAFGIYLLLVKAGYRPTIRKSYRKGRWQGINGTIKNDAFNIELSRYDTKKFLDDIIKFDFIKQIYTTKKILPPKLYKQDQTHKYLCSKTLGISTKISKEHYKGYVYNLEVADDNSYVANGYIVHNCDALAYMEQIAEVPMGARRFNTRKPAKWSIG